MPNTPPQRNTSFGAQVLDLEIGLPHQISEASVVSTEQSCIVPQLPEKKRALVLVSNSSIDVETQYLFLGAALGESQIGSVPEMSTTTFDFTAPPLQFPPRQLFENNP